MITNIAQDILSPLAFELLGDSRIILGAMFDTALSYLTNIRTHESPEISNTLLTNHCSAKLAS